MSNEKIRPHGSSRLLTVREAAERLGVAEITVRVWLGKRRLGYTRLGRAIRIPEQEIARVIERGLVPARQRDASR